MAKSAHRSKMAGARVVCWLNREEWLQIYTYLYGNNAELKRKGLDRVLGWKSRSGGKLSLAIESTADLVLAHLDISSSPFTVDKQLAVSMALVRFVNGMVDMHQKGLYARSVHSIAEEIGLPDWLVDLRHEATHASLPSQDTLHAGVEVALSWLRKEYWEAQVSSYQEAKLTLCSLLEKYYVSMANKRKKKNVEKQAAKVQSVIDKVTNFVRTNNLWSQLQSLLLSKYMFVSTKKDDESSTHDQELSISCPENMINIWYPLFESLDKESADFIPLLVLGIFEAIPEDSTDTSLLQWALWLMQSSTSEKQVFSCKLPWLTILEVILHNPNFLLGEFVDLILEEVTLTDTVKERIKSLANIHNGMKIIGNDGSNETFDLKTADYFKSRDDHECFIDKPATLNDSQHSSGWALDHSETRWDLIPFGEILACEEQTVDALELSLFRNNQTDICTEEKTVNEIVNEYDEEMDESEIGDEVDVRCCDNDNIEESDLCESVCDRIDGSQLVIVLF